MTITKSGTIVALMLVAVTPWLGGGKEPVAVLMTVAALLLAAFLVWRMPNAPKLGTNWLTFGGVGLFSWAVISLIWSVNRYQSMVWIITFGMAVAAFTLSYRFHQTKQAQRWIDGYLLIAAIFSIVGFVFFLTDGYNRLTSTFYWANPMAAYLMPAIIIGGWRFLESKVKSQKSKVWYGALTIINLAAFLLAGSRASIIVLVPIVFIALIKVRKSCNRKSLIILLVAAGILSWGLTAAHFRTFSGKHASAPIIANPRVVEAATQSSTNAKDRLNFLISAWEIFKTRPIAGSGAGTYAAMHPKYQQRVVSASSAAHNFYAQTIAELGAIGAVFMLLMLLGLVSGAWGTLKKLPHLWPAALGLLALLVHTGLDFDAIYPADLLLAAILAGLVYRPVGSGKAKLYPLAAPILLLVLFVPAYSLFISQANASKGQWAEDDHDYALAAGYFAAAHTGLVYNPDNLTKEGIEFYTEARIGIHRKANFEAAMSSALAAQKLDPRDAQHAFLLARAQFGLKNYPAAEVAYKHAIELDPYNEPQYYTDLARLYIAIGKTESARIYIKKVLDLYPAAVVGNRSFIPGLADSITDAKALANRLGIE